MKLAAGGGRCVLEIRCGIGTNTISLPADTSVVTTDFVRMPFVCLLASVLSLKLAEEIIVEIARVSAKTYAANL